MVREKHGSWHGGEGATIARGESALSVIGGPIESLPGADDGWDDISEAKVEFTRARATTVSVAHLARSRDLQKPPQIGPLHLNVDLSSAESSNESS